jgi:hypothetical protein
MGPVCILTETTAVRNSPDGRRCIMVRFVTHNSRRSGTRSRCSFALGAWATVARSATVEADSLMNLYHWSPSRNRASIRRNGLVAGRLSRDRIWRSPWVCFCTCPRKAWSLVIGSKGRFDLWVTNQPARLVRTSRNNGEKRIVRCVEPRSLWLVGTRNH